MKRIHRGRWIWRIAGGMLAVGVLIVGIIVLDNRRLPTRSEVVDRLSAGEKARLVEALNLRHSLGETVWTGWGQADIPIIVYNEAYAFLVAYLDPPPGWIQMPQNKARGGPWEVVPGDRFLGQPYYRQPLPDPEATPQNFTVLVGERWVATLQTKEYAAIAYYQGFGAELPPLLQPIFPYRLVWRILGGDTEVYISGLEHESFHAFQGQRTPERLAAAEKAAQLETRYPWDDPKMAAAWQEELDVLAAAAEVESDAEAADLARQFLELRAQRRRTAGLAPTLVDYERQREWLEGLAKYVELAILRQARLSPDYQPILTNDPQFEGYAGSLRHWAQQLAEVRRTGNREGELRFYYTGLAQAALLDRLLPGWKTRALEADVWLEKLLAEAVGFSAPSDRMDIKKVVIGSPAVGAELALPHLLLAKPASGRAPVGGNDGFAAIVECTGHNAHSERPTDTISAVREIILSDVSAAVKLHPFIDAWPSDQEQNQPAVQARMSSVAYCSPAGAAPRIQGAS